MDFVYYAPAFTNYYLWNGLDVFYSATSQNVLFIIETFTMCHTRIHILKSLHKEAKGKR